MRKTTARIFWKKLVPEKLNPEEQSEIRKAHGEITGNEKMEDLQGILLRYGELTAKVIGCHCPKDFVSNASAIWNVMFEFMGNKGVTALIEASEAQRRSFRKGIGIIASSFARQRRCHFLRRGVVCYCDEHNH